MLDLITFDWAIDTLGIHGGAHLAHLLFKGKCLYINNIMYLTKAQYQECASKDQ